MNAEKHKLYVPFVCPNGVGITVSHYLLWLFSFPLWNCLCQIQDKVGGMVISWELREIEKPNSYKGGYMPGSISLQREHRLYMYKTHTHKLYLGYANVFSELS